jgi:hypothetical protein
MKKWLFLLFCLFLSSAPADVYKWVDEDGNIHYSDRSPQDGAEAMELPKGMYYTPPPLPTRSADRADAEQPEQEGYGELVITQPEMNETIRNNEGLVRVVYNLEPGLVAGDQFKLILDGQELQDRVTDTSVVLNNIERGSHTLKVQVVNGGVVMATSQSVVFHLRKESVFDTSGDSGGDNSQAYTPDYDADAPTGDEYDATETPDYDDGIPEATDGSNFSNVDPNDSSRTVYDSATTPIPSVPGGQFNAGSSYTPNYNQAK